MARLFLLCLAAAFYCCLALLPSPVQGRPGRDHRLLFPEAPHLDAAEPTEQQGVVAVKKATSSWSPLPTPTAGGVVTPELRWVPGGGGANPLHNYYGSSATRQDEEQRTPPAAKGSGVRPELRATPWGSNPLHN